MAKTIAQTATNTVNSEVLELKIANASNFTSFLKRFIVVDTNALLEIGTDNTFVIKSYTAARTAVKYGILKLEDVFDIDPDEFSVPINIKIGIYNIDKLIKTIETYSEKDDVTITFSYELDADKEYYVKSIELNNSTLRLEFECAQKSLFRYMPNDIIKSVFNIDEYGFSTVMNIKTLKLLERVMDLESGTDLTIKINTDDNGEDYITYESKHFEYKDIDNANGVTINEDGDSSDIVINKDYLKYLDKENYTYYTTPTSLLLYSNDSDIKVCLGRVAVKPTSANN